MKRLLTCITAIFTLLTCIPLSGCTEPVEIDSDKLSIVTTCFPPYDFARAVTGGNADITMLLCPGAEAHSYEPAPLDILKIQQCDVFIYIGGEGEVWADKILDSFDSSGITIIRLSDYAEKLEEEAVAGASPNGHHHHHHDEAEEAEEAEEHSHDEESEEEHGHVHSHDEGESFDEHIWTSLRNAEKCVEGIEHELCEAFPDNSEIYIENAHAYIEQMRSLDEEYTEMTENAPSDLVVIGDRFPFRYLTHDYGLEYFAAFSGCSSESEPGVYTMAFLIDELIGHELDTVFYLEFSTQRLAKKLSDATGAQMLPLHSCHNVSKEDFENGVTYIELMKRNFENLREALY